MRWILLIIGLSAGLAAAVLFSANSGAAVTPNGQNESSNLIQILVAANEVLPGQKLREENLKWADWPESAVQQVFIVQQNADKDLDAVVGRIVRGGLIEGMPLMETDLVDGGAGYLSAILTPGMRAVALPISAAQTAGGFILPDDRVDVLLAKKCPDGTLCGRASDVVELLQNVRVLAIDQAGTVATDGTAIVGETATLELSPEDARVLVAAQTVGTPTLILRAAGDDLYSQIEPVVVQAEPVVAQEGAALPAAPPAPVAQSVRVIRNGQAQSYDVN